jgi:hypothetical protein
MTDRAELATADDLADIAFLASCEAEEMIDGKGTATPAMSRLLMEMGDARCGPLQDAIELLETGFCGLRIDREGQRRLLRSACDGSRDAGDLFAVRDLCQAIHDILSLGPDRLRPDLVFAPARPIRRNFRRHRPRPVLPDLPRAAAAGRGR